ncbi:hypothetical protein Cch01nite_20400 [Cellulomonas chitinilytica]|uniref:Uncharacterized protein n=1 Tax=Cellulomonas chitinilytica TaxID=398759 RepID=A0A919P484_9CELL|nr:hypothetical protein [Cellulomonas chitinilytica]GIG21316.1 hypothetical protein Cch01nite_20400 [Cellulomonas chitinilytica]
MLPHVRALSEQTQRGLSSTRRVDGRVVIPFLDTISTPVRTNDEVWDRG